MDISVEVCYVGLEKKARREVAKYLMSASKCGLIREHV
jgi:hypothetical protein